MAYSIQEWALNTGQDGKTVLTWKCKDDVTSGGFAHGQFTYDLSTAGSKDWTGAGSHTEAIETRVNALEGVIS